MRSRQPSAPPAPPVLDAGAQPPPPPVRTVGAGELDAAVALAPLRCADGVPGPAGDRRVDRLDDRCGRVPPGLRCCVRLRARPVRAGQHSRVPLAGHGAASLRLVALGQPGGGGRARSSGSGQRDAPRHRETDAGNRRLASGHASGRSPRLRAAARQRSGIAVGHAAAGDHRVDVPLLSRRRSVG